MKSLENLYKTAKRTALPPFHMELSTFNHIDLFRLRMIWQTLLYVNLD